MTSAALLRAVDQGDMAELARAMGEPLTFGTAGIRGEVGPGAGRMNRATVIRTTAGLAAHLRAKGRAGGTVVLGFDARPASKAFAEDAAGVLAAAGIGVRYFSEVTPTPLVAFTARHLGATAAIVITASHNPPADNGYKVYGANAAQIIPPEDAEISDAIACAGPADEIPRVSDGFAAAHPRLEEMTPLIEEEYFRAVDEVRPSPRGSDLVIVYTPLHGVGGRLLTRMMTRAGHLGVTPVPSQFEPDGEFPTVPFPNPEEEGAMDLALGLAAELSAAAVIANDPDADRLAAAVAHRGEFRQLSGNDLGALLGDYVLRNWSRDSAPIVASSIVSSPILGRIATAHGAHHEVTLTGFKWIVNAGLALQDRGVGVFAFGYEEALGYTVGETVRDKDGLSAALVFTDLVAEEAEAGRSVVDRLHDIWSASGMWVSAQTSLVRPGVEGQALIAEGVRRLGDSPPESIGGIPVTDVVDYRKGAVNRPRWLGAQDLIELRLGDQGRVLVRPSGTEPKLKIYVDLVGGIDGDPDLSHGRLQAQAQDLSDRIGGDLGI